ncbi:MAG: hypothetical protein AABY31_03575, partial [Thermoproteota archaeon]
MPRTTGMLIASILCLSIALIGIDNSSAVSPPSLKMKADGMTVIVELGNPKSGSVPVYEISITSDVNISSGKGPSGWSMKKQTTTRTFDTIIFSTESKPIMPGKSAQFSFTSKNLTLGIWWHAYDQNGKLITEGFVYSPFFKLINGLVDVVRFDHSSYEAIVKEDFSSAKENTAAKRKSLFMVREEYQNVKANLEKNSRESVEAILNYFDKTINMEERG